MNSASFWMLLLLALGPIDGSAKDPVDYISPLIGTGHQGKTYPGAATPGGMVQLSPDTIIGGDNGSGYRHYNTTIQGFSFTHMSGVGWYGDLGNFLVVPTNGPLRTWYGETDHPGTGYLSRFSPTTEVAEAGYYAVTLDDYHIRAEMTAAPHSGILRFTFPENSQSRVQVDLAHRVGGTSLSQSVKLVGDHTLEGEIVCTPEGGGWGHGANIPYTVFFHAECSKPFRNFGAWSATLPPGPYKDILGQPAFIDACRNAEVLPGCKEMQGAHLGFYGEFPTHADETVSFKVGISFVSIAGATANLHEEIPAWDFDQTRQNARQLWAQALKNISVEGGTEDQKTAYYTALYHALLDPRIFADLNGDYPGGDGQIHTTTSFTKRTIFSGWDVYRSEFPLLTLINPTMVKDSINSFVELADQNGTHYFDRWEFLNAYTGCMNGNPIVPVINDAWQKGIRNYDAAKAYTYSVNSGERNGNGPLGYKATYGGSLSASLEYDNDDWNLSQLAAGLGKNDDAAQYAAQSQSYRKLFNPDEPWTYKNGSASSHPEWKGWFNGRNEDGSWMPWEGLLSAKVTTESTLYQQGWFVPYDVPGLIELLGGKDAFVAKLSDFFEHTPNVGQWNDYYNQPNEPVHLVPFLFNRAGAPWLTQKWIRVIDGAYGVGPEGLCGDEDVGQMSAWFVLAAGGLHQACPGDLRYEIFSPLFDKITIRLDPKYTHGGTFTITAQNNSPANVYIQSATLNGKPLDRCWITYAEITSGGTLDLVLGPEPNKQWGLAEK